jgi:hypothetical protein
VIALSAAFLYFVLVVIVALIDLKHGDTAAALPLLDNIDEPHDHE